MASENGILSSTTSVAVKLITGYENSDASRQYTFDCAASLVSGVKAKVKAINSSLAGGTDGGLSSFFVDDDGNGLATISSAFTVVETVDELDIDDDSDASD